MRVLALVLLVGCAAPRKPLLERLGTRVVTLAERVAESWLESLARLAMPDGGGVLP